MADNNNSKVYQELNIDVKHDTPINLKINGKDIVQIIIHEDNLDSKTMIINWDSEIYEVIKNDTGAEIKNIMSTNI